jgi:hypothetical protein
VKSSPDSHRPDAAQAPTAPTAPVSVPTQRNGGGACDLYSPGHLLHYRHQGDAVLSPAAPVRHAWLEGTDITLLLEAGPELVWRHHDADRVQRVLEAIPTSRVAYPAFHALRVGPYWFNCATAEHEWRDCGLVTAARERG